MISGPTLVINGTLLGGGILALFLFSITPEVAYSAANTADQRVTSTLGSHSVETTGGRQSDERRTSDGSSDFPGKCELSQRFPPSILQWCELITRYANQRGLPPDLVAAVVWQESGGDPQAYSRSGAVGLMQVMPRDGLAAGFLCANGPCFSARPSTSELQDPEFNVAFGTRMLAGLLKRNGSLREALKAYGPMNVDYSYADKVLGIYQKYKSGD